MESLPRCARTVIASVLVLASVAAYAGPTVRTQSAASSPAGSIPLGPDAFKLPAVPDYEAGGFRAQESNRDKAGAGLPDRVDLGKSVLRFDTNRSALNSGPKVGIDDADQTVLNPGIPTHKDSPLQPNYFGLTLTTPTH